MSIRKKGLSNRPIASKDRAETFVESDFSVSQSGTRIKNESVELGITLRGNITSRPNDNDTFSSGRGGVVINPNTELAGISATLSSYQGATQEIRILDSGYTILKSRDISGTAGDTVSIEYPLNAGTRYVVEVVTNDERGYMSPSFPITGTDLDIVDGSYNGGDSTAAIGVNDLEGLTANTSGSVTIEWPEPTDIYRWDAATFTTTKDSETVDVFIEESTDGGSTWTEIAGPISRGEQIKADPGARVRFRVELSRTDTGNNPTLDAIYRRWVV